MPAPSKKTVSRSRWTPFASPYTQELNIKNLCQTATKLDTLIETLCGEMRNFFQVKISIIYLLDEKTGEIVSRATAGRMPKKEIRIAVVRKSIVGYVASTQNTLNIRDALNQDELHKIDPDLRHDSEWDYNAGIKTKQVLAAPIVIDDKTVGVVQLINKNSNISFTDDEADKVAEIVDHLGKAIRNIQSGQKFPAVYKFVVENGVLTEKELLQALHSAQQQRQDVERVLLNDFKASKKELGKALARFYDVPFEDLAATHYNPLELIKGKNVEYFERSLCAPLDLKDNKLVLAVNDPADQSKVQDIQGVYRASRVELRFSLKDDIVSFLKAFRSTATSATASKNLDRSVGDILDEMKGQVDDVYQPEEEIADSADVNDSAVVLLVRKIIEDGYYQLASDIHIEPYGQNRDAEVRFRIDGVCQKVLNVPRGYIRPVISRIKVMAKMDIAESRRPQDGKIQFKTSKGKTIELRAVTIPTAGRNEDVVLRLLTAAEPLKLETMMRHETFERFAEIIQKPYGLVLVVGPTGSGKTTTLHSALNFINKPERKIWTAEDPVEITQHGLRQLQINNKIGLNFAAAMRTFLRSDPDVIMVGEMRDQETVRMGLEASLTGHLVFSTLHTNSAPETVTRLMDLGMDPYNFADALLGILAQRLTRVLCSDCRQPYNPEKHEYDHIKEVYGPFFDERLGIPYSKDLTFYRDKGCHECNDVGYQGRMGLFELLSGDRELKKLIIGRAPVHELREKAIECGMDTLVQDGIHHTFKGDTDMKQVLSVCSR